MGAALTLTKGHLKLAKFLEKLGFEVVLEQHLGPFFVDIWLPDYHLAVEYDGPYHKLKRKKDAKRDQVLIENYGVRAVLRVEEKEFADSKGLEEKILAAIDETTSSSQRR